MKIKMIDLLVKIANGEESTKVKTKYDSSDWEINDFLFSIYNEFNSRNNAEIVEFLNDYVEIIEQPKKIEKLNDKLGLFGDGNTQKIINELNYTRTIINELIDEINKLKEK